MRTHVPFSEEPVTRPSNFSPTRDSSTQAATALRTFRSTLLAAVQWRASSASSSVA
jgi:hypothetical protein